MSETRRVQLISSIPAVTEKEKIEKPAPTVRLVATLEESTDVSCPEFSFVELVKNATGVSDDPALIDADDPFAAQDRAEHDKMVAIAKGFEAKYGSKPSKKHKLNYQQEHEIRDLVDLGDGYDETDAFIDNTEAYDEFVPSCLTTKHGGFYVNFGQLDFREVSDDSDDGLHRKKKMKRRRVLSDTEQNDSESSDVKKKDNVVRENGKEHKIINKKRKDEAKVKKRPPGRPPKIGKSALSAERMHGSSALLPSKLQHELASSRHEQNDVVGSHVSVTEQRLFSPPKTAPLAGAGDAAVVSPSVASACSIDSAINSVISQGRAEIHNVPDLPDKLPPELVESMNAIKDAASKLQSTGSRIFTAEVNQLLLQIETKCRTLAHSTRSAVFCHLAKVLSCEKEMLMKRTKRMVLAQHDEKLRQPIALLKEAVQSAMPALLERHMSDVNATEQLRRERQLDNREVVRRDGGPTSDSDDNAPDESHDAAATSGGEKQKRIVAPRKKFEWTSSIRSLLADIVRIKMEHYDMSKVRSQSAEEYLKAFFEAELKPIWPQGWIQTRMLFKESRTTHQKWTSSQPKLKKMVVTGARTSAPGSRDMQNGVPLMPNFPAVVSSDALRRSPGVAANAKPSCDVISMDAEDNHYIPRLFAEQPPDGTPNCSKAHISPKHSTPNMPKTCESGRSILAAADSSVEHRRSSIDTPVMLGGMRSSGSVLSIDRPQHSSTSRPGRDGIKLNSDTSRMMSVLRKQDSASSEFKPDVQGLTTSHSYVDKFSEFLTHGGSTECKTPLVAAVVSPSVMSGCLLEDRMTHVTPTLSSSSISSSVQLSPIKSDTLSASTVRSLPLTELRRDKFPPYTCSTSKRSTAVVAPSLARTRPTQPVTSVAPSTVSSLRFPVLPSSTLQRQPVATPLSVFSPRSTQSLSKVMCDLSRRYADSVSVCRSLGPRSLLAPSSAASSGISYSLALSSALASGSHSSAAQSNTSHLTAGQSLIRAAHFRQLHTVSSSSGNPVRREAFRELADRYVEPRNTRDLSTSYNDFYPMPQRTSGANIAVTTIGHTFASSQPLMHRTNLTRYQPYHGLNQTSRPAAVQHPTGLFPSSSAPSISSRLQSLQTHSNSGSNRSSQMPASSSPSILQTVMMHGDYVKATKSQ